jgi:hypothetical protein
VPTTTVVNEGSASIRCLLARCRQERVNASRNWSPFCETTASKSSGEHQTASLNPHPPSARGDRPGEHCRVREKIAKNLEMPLLAGQMQLGGQPAPRSADPVIVRLDVDPTRRFSLVIHEG